ncbi:MAG: alpha/beta fold hydrolase [Kiritimatiellia bacterium]|jgi:polyhydroxyalkanoate synthase|nr:alpha/beta fold hydrolase [Pseudomonadales bacterium]MDP6469935.1 alpha/beta fold hydrolase [Pseudomonadales bacterium]MDP6828955.1 alpha/beta fold hydrolase [Pseudomonadales bacterium]MDP7024660.1 alpha/beta fold hydrolase [Kiritimatiellia bacterium]|tara:strand:+ start:362 stop:2038 length:1677 start_codon:yes stop_codon:yes gene_type:complete
MPKKIDSPSIDDHILTLNPIVGVSIEDLAQSTAAVVQAALTQPTVAAKHLLQFNAELIKVIFGNSDLQPSPRDARFADTAFEDNALYAGLAKSWLAWQAVVNDWVDEIGFEGEALERARFVASVATDAMAPTNFLLGNPSALKKAFETRGASLVAGLRNLVDDLQNNGGMPSQVDKSAFDVGNNVANSPGCVIHRDAIVELIQYQGATDTRNSRPLLIVPPQINKYYIYDMSPGKSMVKYLVEQGFQVFVVSWRNPTEENRNWGLDDYVTSLESAIGVTLDVSGADAVNVIGACAGGITLAVALGYLAGKGDLGKIASLTLMVNVLQPAADDSVIGLFANEETIEAARKRSAKAGVLDGNDTARVFNWMRPNDLIWNYVVSNYLHGESPPAFDILYWNNDTTRLPARLHSDFLDVFKDNLLSEQGALEIKGVPIDLAKVNVPAFITGGTTDHITPWQACYRSTQILGGEITYVLSTAGHIQSLINPPTSSKRKFYTNDATPPAAEDWLADAREHAGSWWPFWTEWLNALSNEQIPVAAQCGNERHTELCAAPGTYVLE